MDGMKDYTHPARAEFSLPAILHALSDPVRLMFVRALAERGELPCCAIRVPVAKSTLSHHLDVLREAGVIQTRAHGTQSLTSLRRGDMDTCFPGLLEAVLRAAQGPEAC